MIFSALFRVTEADKYGQGDDRYAAVTMEPVVRGEGGIETAELGMTVVDFSVVDQIKVGDQLRLTFESKDR